MQRLRRPQWSAALSEFQETVDILFVLDSWTICVLHSRPGLSPSHQPSHYLEAPPLPHAFLSFQTRNSRLPARCSSSML